MNRGDVGFVLGLMGFVAGCYAAYTVSSMKIDVDDARKLHMGDNDSLAALGERVEKLDASHKELVRRVNGLDANPRSGGDRVKALEERIDALEKSRAAGGAASPTQGEPPKDAKGAAGEFDELLKKMTSGAATADDKERFWELAREKPALLADLIKQFEKSVADAPRDKEAHRNLAQAYLVKLMAVPDGMEKGLWSNKMIGQEKAILDIDPEDWDARFSIGINYSFWPEQFNKRPDAIKEFETLRKIQETKTPDPKHAQTYFQLRQLYLKDGKTDEAKAVLDEGLRRFPDDEELKKAKDGAK
jgi:tetratricopeptide (TPR) repeat protein